MIIRMALAVATLLPGLPVAASVYSEVTSALALQDHRLPGSANAGKSEQALIEQLKKAGLTPHIQTFDTLAPVTVSCTLSVDGKPVSAVFPVNGGAAPFTTTVPITGPVVRVGGGTLSEINGKSLEGGIALLDLDAPHLTLAEVFLHGARAVILTGTTNMSQWTAASICQEGPVMVPVVYVPRAAAESSGLLGPAGQVSVRLESHVELRDVVGHNVWVALPGEANATFKLGREEALVLSATLQTAGMVPDFCPQSRDAANCALLADVVCRLAEAPRKRTVVAVFLGSPYAAQEGARHFYYALSHGAGNTDTDSLDLRGQRYGTELEMTKTLYAASSRADLFEGDDDAARGLVARVKMKLTGYVNNLNSQIRDVRVTQAARKRNLKRDDASDNTLDDEALAARDASLTARKTAWNALRQELTARRLKTDSESQSSYSNVVGAVRRDLESRKVELERAILHNDSSRELAAALVDKTIVGHFNFNFADARAPWMLCMVGAYDLFSDKGIDPGNLLMHLSEIGKISGAITQQPGRTGLLAETLLPYYKPFSLAVPVQQNSPATAGVMLGGAGFEMMTVGDPLTHDQMPLRETCDLSPLAESLSTFIDTLATRPELSRRPPFQQMREENRLTYLYENGNSYTGTKFVNYSRGASEVEGNANNAIAMFASGKSAGSLAGLSRCPWARINTDGFVFMPMINRTVAGGGELYAFGYNTNGLLDRTAGTLANVQKGRIPLFYAYGGGAFSYGFSPFGSGSYQARTLDGRLDSPHKNSFSGGPSSLGTYYADKQCRIKRIGTGGEMILGATAEKPLGTGVPLDAAFLLNFDGIRQGAEDYWRLNEYRLDVLRQRNIVSDDLVRLHADAREHLDEAREAHGQNAHSLARAHEIVATCLENRVYAPLRNIADDLVKAVVVLLLLNIPFAFALERLLCGFASIYKQVTGFVGFFLMTFGILYVTHPAFALASAPIVIFLAFVIILLGGITMYIVMGKIKQEIRRIQGMASTVHGVESDSNTAVAAILIGISGMRNRPLKTFLTAITVVLLTFTILVFASFTSQIGVVETYMGKGQDEDRIELHRFSYLDISRELSQTINRLYGDRYDVFGRGGLYLDPTKRLDQGITPLSPDRVLYCPASGKIASLGAIVGLTPGEAAVNVRLGNALPGFSTPQPGFTPIYLPPETAARLEIAKGGEVRLNGHSFTYVGPFNQAELLDVTTIDQKRILPPDFAATMKNMGKTQGAVSSAGELEKIDVGTFAWFSPEQVAITDIRALQENYPNVILNFLALYPRTKEVDLEKNAREMAPIFQGAVHAKSAEGSRKFYFTEAVQGSGFGDVIVPLLLGGLIIFSSLMGSIVDREREIFTYSALGLSPVSVGALFFAESCVYSVVGGMGGYLLSQIVAAFMTFLGAHGFFTPPEMNFSSLTSVLTILIVMAVVILSTIFPAIKAGKSANPGVARKWKMPLPEGDQLRFIFPFTVSQADFAGILSFLREHFENHGDATLGNFAARHVRLYRAKQGERECMGISADISLAPFDLGIFQHFKMYSQEFEIKGIDEVVVELQRVGGTSTSWVRGNRTFADELRQQFLLWRSLPIETVQHYRRKTEEEIGS
jgi:hypothetical protein